MVVPVGTTGVNRLILCVKSLRSICYIMLQQTEDDQTNNILAQYAVETGFVLFVYDLD